jgi:K+-sensing histidine kinase KdpD
MSSRTAPGPPHRQAGKGVGVPPFATDLPARHAARAVGPPPSARLVDVDVTRPSDVGSLPAPAVGISRLRQVAGAGVGVAGLAAVAAGLAGHRSDVLLSTPVLLVLSVVVASSMIGGIRPGLPVAISGFLLLNFVFTEPYGTFDVHRFDQGLALAVYLATAVAVSVVVSLAARRRSLALRAAAEAAELSALAGAHLGPAERLPDVLLRIRQVFAQSYAAVVELGAGGERVVQESGLAADGQVTRQVVVSDQRALQVSGSPLTDDDLRVLGSFARAAVAALEGQELADKAADAERLASVDQLRTALLAGVGHDLRTPLAGIKAAVTSLRAVDVEWSPAERDELLGAVEGSADRLDALVSNLLAASRLDAGAVSTSLAAVDVEEIVGRALGGIGDGERVVVDVPNGLPLVLADVGLAERVVANLVDNALRHSGRGTNVLVRAAVRGGDVVVSVVDTGPGVPTARYADLFTPYQRSGDRSTGGLGLGLSVARGFTLAMGGSLEPAQTPGGGLTMHLRLPQAQG